MPVALASTKAFLNHSTTNTLAEHMAEAEVARCVMAPAFMANVQKFLQRDRKA